jgi:hypothetical protein
MLGIPLLLIVGIVAGMRLGWWGPRAFIALSGLGVLVLPAVFWFNSQVHSIRHRCECGRPDYVFMGLLGRSYCYRCSTCGRILRLRD